MKHQRQELTLKNALTDPLVRTVMAADGVDPQELRAMLSEIVATLARRSQLPPARRPAACNELRLNTLQ
jgi:hypothetical protein